MFDLKEIRDHPDTFDAGLARRGLAPRAEEILKLDEEARKFTLALNELQSKRNAASKQVGAAKAKGDEAGAKRLMEEVETIKAQMPAAEAEQKKRADEIREILSGLPNLPAGDVPDGASEADNVEIRTWGEANKSDTAKEHFDIGEALGLMDFETAAKMSGARFVLLKGQLARLERAIASFMLDLHTMEFGYAEMSPPLLVRDAALFGTGQLPKFAEDLFMTGSSFKTAEEALNYVLKETGSGTTLGDIKKHESAIRKRLSEQTFNHWLIPTAEVPLTNIVREQILAEEELPLRFTAHTPCFRSEAGSAGKDTRGMIRLHQFSKVELVSITTPEQSQDEHERMTSAAETVLQRLDIPYRTIILCTGDMGFSARKTYDIEAWLPGQGCYREISSCSNCGDFQARRMNTRCRPKGEKKTRFAHTLNGSGLAVGRTLVTILENYVEADGSVAVPDALKPYMGGVDKIEKAV